MYVRCPKCKCIVAKGKKCFVCEYPLKKAKIITVEEMEEKTKNGREEL